MGDTSELKNMAEGLRSGTADAGRKKPLTPAQLRDRALQKTAEEAKAKKEKCLARARSMVDLVEGKIKPGLAGMILPPEKAIYFETSATDRESLIEPLAEYFNAINFEPNSPAYHLALLVAAYSFITYGQYEAMRAAGVAPAKPNGEDAAKDSWNPLRHVGIGS